MAFKEVVEPQLDTRSISEARTENLVDLKSTTDKETELERLKRQREEVIKKWRRVATQFGAH